MTGRAKPRPLSARLALLGDSVAGAKVHVREITGEREAAKAEVERLGEARVEAFASADETLAEKIQDERLRAEATVLDFAERVAGAERAADRAQAKRAEFAADNFTAILEERTPDALAATSAVRDAIEALVRAQREWEGFAADVVALQRAAALPTGTVPTFPEPLAALARDARRAGGTTVPAPLPASH